MSLDIGSDRLLVFDAKKGRLAVRDKSNEYSALLIPLDSFFSLVDEMFTTFGSGSVVMLERMGEGVGRANAMRNIQGWGKELSVKSVFNTSSSFGNGRYQLVSFDSLERRSTVRVHDCAFARQSDPEGRSMWYLRGVLKGYFSEIFGDDSIKCIEPKCASSGSKYCEFVILPKGKENE